MAAIALLAMPCVRRPVEKESAAPERGEQLAPHLLGMLDRSDDAVGRGSATLRLPGRGDCVIS